MGNYAKRLIAIITCLTLFLTFNIISVCETSETSDASEVLTGLYRGDANMDGEINMKDILLIRLYMAQITKLQLYIAGDATGDDEVDMRDILYLRKYMAYIVTDLIPIKESELTTTSRTTIQTTLPTKYPINHEDPAINFIEGSKATLGVWWWGFGMPTANEDLCFELLKKNQVTEIYYYCYAYLSNSGDRAIVHNFVQKAMNLGMRVAALYDNQSVVKAGNTSFTKTVGYYQEYKKEYPEDALYALHCDIEPQKASDKTKTWCQNYVDNFLLAQVAPAREQGVAVELDCGIGWNAMGQELTYTGKFKDLYVENVNPVQNEDGSYTLNFFDAIANNVDSMVMMSYRDTARKVYEIGKEAMKICNKAGTKIVLGVETMNTKEGDQVDFSAESKEIMYIELSQLLVKLENNEPVGGYGMAIHHITAWYNLREILVTTTTTATTTIPVTYPTAV